MRLTPFNPRTSELCNPYNWSLLQNWLLADMYAPDHIQEYYAIRSACGVFDISPIPKYHIYGPDAARYLDRIVTQDVSRCAIGQALYTAWCDDDGKIMDDGILTRLSEQHWLIPLQRADQRRDGGVKRSVGKICTKFWGNHYDQCQSC
mgnify:FL=1